LEGELGGRQAHDRRHRARSWRAWSAETPQRTAAADAARRRFEENCRRQRAELDSAGASLPAPPPHLLDPEREKRLRALGYAQ
jgi:hypothetical protein